jgi:hypothetical protein
VNPDRLTPLQHLSHRVEADPSFLGYHLAAWLGLPADAAGVSPVAGRFGCDAGRLGEICGIRD